MVGRRKSIGFNELKRIWGEVSHVNSCFIPRKRYGLVVAQEPVRRIGFLALLYAKLMKARLVYEIHGTYLSYLSTFDRAIALWLLRRADYIRAVNRKILKQLDNLGVGNVLYIPAVYVDTLLFRPVKPHDERRKRVIFAGRLVEEKKLDKLLEIFAIVVDESGDAELTVVGTGPLYGYLLEITNELGISDKVKFLNKWIDQLTLARLYNESAVVVCTSEFEGGPRFVFEAMACETPFVSSRVGLLSEVCRDGREGFFSTVNKKEEFASRIVALLENSKIRSEMGRRGRILVEQQFEWNKALRRYAYAYLQILKNSR